jgi:hypothetical protein
VAWYTNASPILVQIVCSHPKSLVSHFGGVEARAETKLGSIVAGQSLAEIVTCLVVDFLLFVHIELAIHLVVGLII